MYKIVVDSYKAIKGKMKIKRHNPTEYLLDNFIDKDFQAVLLPLRLFQSSFLIFKYSIKNNFITPEINTSAYIKAVLGLIGFLLCFFIRFLLLKYFTRHFSNGVIIFLFYIDLFHFSLVTIMIYLESALNINNIVELVITLQKLLISIKIDKKSFYLKHRILNWLSVLALVSFHFFHVGFHNRKDSTGFLFNFPLETSMLIFDVNIIIATRTVVMIKNMLLAWTNAMQEYKNGDITEEEISEKSMFDAYVNITRAFRLCNRVYQFSFTFYVFQAFIYILLTLESLIEVGRLSPEESVFKSIETRIISTLWNMKNVVLIATLSIACENFYRSVQLAESYCAMILNSDQAACMRKTCKNVMRLNRAFPRKLSAFGVFELDAAFPLRLLGGLVSYTVVLLQFAFAEIAR